MNNTNENKQLDALDTVGDCSIEQSEGTCGTCEQDGETRETEGQTPQEGQGERDCDSGNDRPENGERDDNTVNDESSETDNDDATMRVLKMYPKVCARIAALMAEHAETVALDVISKGLGYDDAVAMADNTGYVRGKNEKIELEKNHRVRQIHDYYESDVEEQQSGVKQVAFPRYERKSFWDL